MSLILDALRKMELERKAKRQGAQEIRAEVLNYRGTNTAAKKSRIAPITAALVLIFAAAAGFYYFTRPEAPKEEQAKASAPLQQEQPDVIRPPASLQPPPAEMPAQNSIPAKIKSTPAPTQPAAKTAAISKNNGAEGITVSGIAWQDERYLRRAVINGSLVGEGAEILGAKVIEIRENRVRFSRSGDIFEVVHSSGAGR